MPLTSWAWGRTRSFPLSSASCCCQYFSLPASGSTSWVEIIVCSISRTKNTSHSEMAASTGISSWKHWLLWALPSALLHSSFLKVKMLLLLLLMTQGFMSPRLSSNLLCGWGSPSASSPHQVLRLYACFPTPTLCWGLNSSLLGMPGKPSIK